MIKDTELAWLAGMIDADGNIGIYGSRSPLGRNYRPTVGFVTTCRKTRDTVERLLRELGLAKGQYWALRTNTHQPTWRPRWDLSVRGAETRVLPLLEAVLPYLVTKRDEAELVLEFIRGRRMKGKLPIACAEMELIQRVKAFKQSRNTTTAVVKEDSDSC